MDDNVAIFNKWLEKTKRGQRGAVPLEGEQVDALLQRFYELGAMATQPAGFNWQLYHAANDWLDQQVKAGRLIDNGITAGEVRDLIKMLSWNALA